MIDGVSILVVCYGRVKLLQDLFVSLDIARANCPLPTELIVVDNSGEKEAREIELLCRAHDATYYYELASVATKRNTCARLANYSLLYYCDSDCVVTPDVLNKHIEKYGEKNIGAVSGPVILEGEKNSLIKVLSKTSWCDAFTQPFKHDTLQWGTTANFSVLKEAFEESGGFNVKFPNKPGGEDVDIGFRICDKGYTIQSAPEAVVYHSNKTWLNFKEVATRLFSYGRSNVLVALEHPKRLIADVNWLAVWLLVSVCSLLAGGLLSPWFFILPPAVFLLYWTLGSVWKSIAERRGLGKTLLIELLSVIEKAGTIAGCWKYKTCKPLYRQVMYSQYQEHGTYPENQKTYFLLIVSILIPVVFVLFML